ncbi:acetolactate synthase large subunit [Afifella sp. H1R]|uniref:acetolactate synthase large subunit n=1 Tax=Afifella sp. H1R TaxID=2908841 RepID=UPI001F21E186|nr:acetolactate synthase large subunit [Afifella sp. H1R]MCF1503136.1 acetolactate synthase large subunit [Afifella sp. H1R]
MNGAHSLVRTLLNQGVDTCFANPGTSEMHFVAALDQIDGMRCVLGLQENVVTGMADGYARIAGKPACTLLHCGPGLANGLANLHNARRARAAIVNIVGDQATYHRPHDAPLTMDTSSLAHTVSGFVRASACAADVGRDAATATQAARALPGQVATLILPSDTCWNEGGIVADALPALPGAPLDPHAVETAARMLRNGRETLILLGGAGLLQPAQELAWRVAQATGATLMADFVCGQVARGRGRVPLARVPYVAEAARAALERFEQIILVAAKPPVSFFAYPGQPSIEYRAEAELQTLARGDQDVVVALQALVDALGAPQVAMPDPGPRPEVAHGAPTPEGLARTVAALMPENTILCEEAISYSRGLYDETYAAPAHDMLHLAGGAIGDGMPVATGAAVAGAGRRVINLQADGSAMYTIQSLWTQARERLPVTTVILNNRQYAILLGEYANVGATPGETAMQMLDLGNPDLGWIKLANGMGVEAARAETLDELADLMQASFERDGPFLIELMI